MTDLLSPEVPAASVTVATGGYATPEVLRNWIARGVFRTPAHLLPEPRAGKPRMYPRLAVYEAAMLAWAAASGLPIRLITGAWGQLTMHAIGHGASGWVDADFIEAIKAGQVRDFDPDADTMWVIFPVGWADGKADQAAVRRMVRCKAIDLSAVALSGDAIAEGIIVINVAAIVRLVEARLADARA